MLSRALIVLLLVLNLGVAAWWLLRAEPTTPALPAHPAGVPRLQLVKEAGAAIRGTAQRPAATADTAAPAPAPAEEAAASETTVPATAAPSEDEDATAPAAVTLPELEIDTVPAAAPPPELEIATAPATATPLEPEITTEALPEADASTATATRCFSFGPYTDPAVATAARAKLPAGARLRRAAARRGANWNVLMPPQADHAAALALAQRIDAAGFKDNYVIGEGASANGIALGRFGSEEKARSHQAALQAAGFQAQIQAPADSTIWLDVEADASFDANAARSAIGASRWRGRRCAAGT